MAELQLVEKAAEAVPGAVSREGHVPPAHVCYFSLLIDRSRNLIFLVMCLQVFQSSFGVWALTVLGAAILGVPYLATEHTKKVSCMDYFSRVYRLLPYGFSSFYPPFCTTGSVTAGDSVCLIPT